MEPIISPAFIYLLSIIGSIKALLFIVVIVGAFTCAVVIAWCLDDGKKIPRCAKCGTVAIIIALLLNIFMPDRNTLIAMYATKYITVNNIKSGKEIVIDTIKEVVDAINKEEK